MRQRAGGEPLLGFDLAGELGSLALRFGCAAAGAFKEALEAVALAFGPSEARAHLGELLLQAELAGLLQREQLGELRNLRSEARERGVFAADLLRQVELHDHEHGEQEDDAEDQGRQRVDESGPVVDAAVAAGACKSHVVLLEVYFGSAWSPYVDSCSGSYLFTSSRTRISSRRRMSRCCWACESTQSRIICCSVRMWWTSP